jgi:hypothetical protein
MKMLAFHGKQEIKNLYLARVRAHRKADQIIKGVYWNKGKGCAVGCTIHSRDHRAYETELGIPTILARLEDGIFEWLPDEQAMKWPEQFLSAIKPGADLSMVWPKFAVWMLVDPKCGVLQFAKTEMEKKSITDMADAYSLVVKGKSDNVDWKALRDAAASDAFYAFYASDAFYVAKALYATDDAFYSAYASGCAAADDDKVRINQAKKLLALLRAA